MGWRNSLDVVDTICLVRDQAQEARMIDNGKSPYDVIDFIAHTLTNTLMHEPCVQLRQAGYDGREDLVTAARELFNLTNSVQ